MTALNQNPEQRARDRIDALLRQAGWVIQYNKKIDFAAGLVFGLHGAIEKVTPRVFLLSPSGVEVAQQTDIRTGNLFV